MLAGLTGDFKCNIYYIHMKWLFLVHQVRTPNSKERVKVWRAIKKTGAVLYRNSVYVLPYGKDRLEDFQWVCQQINDSKGEASVFVSNAESKKEDRAIEALFRKTRQEDYTSLVGTARRLLNRLHSLKKRKGLMDRQRESFQKELKQLRETFEDIRRIDFFSDSTPKEALHVMNQISAGLTASAEQEATPLLKTYSAKEFQRKLWATREGIHVDRLGSAWLIRRFIDASARFFFGRENSLPGNAIPFDVFGVEFGHHGQDCTFETMIKAFRIRDKAVLQIAEIIHDIDLKDHKFGRSEASGLDLVIRSLSGFVNDDHKLLEIGSSILEGLYQSFSTKSKKVKT